MPIKFRCIHCRQLLGISRAKAGQPVDCPTCGRTVRVPSLDGRIDPVAPPGLNLRDEALVQALDALAMIGQLAPEEDPEQEQQPDEAEQAAAEHPRAPQPDLEPPRPVAVAVAPPLPAEPVAPRPPSPPPDANASAAAIAELSWMANAGRPPQPSEPANNGHRRWTLALAAVVGVSGLIIGFLAGWIAGRQATPSPVPAANVPEPPANTPAPAAAPQASANLALRGRITYRGESGDSRPDAGARVIVLPQTRAGEVRLPATGFRAGDAPVDFQVAQASLRALGGDVAIVNEDGSYEIFLASAGAYHVLVLSRFQPQSEESPMDPGLRSLLETWFARPDQVLGRVRHFLGQARYTGSDIQLWDHSFEPAA